MTPVKFSQNLILGTFSMTMTHCEQKRSPRTDMFLFQYLFSELHQQQYSTQYKIIHIIIAIPFIVRMYRIINIYLYI